MIFDLTKLSSTKPSASLHFLKTLIQDSQINQKQMQCDQAAIIVFLPAPGVAHFGFGNVVTPARQIKEANPKFSRSPLSLLFFFGNF